MSAKVMLPPPVIALGAIMVSLAVFASGAGSSRPCFSPPGGVGRGGTTRVDKPAPRSPGNDDPNPLAKLMGRLALWVAVGWLVVGVAFALLLAALTAAGVKM